MAAAVEELNSLAAAYPSVSVVPIAQLSTHINADITALVARTRVNAAVTGPAMAPNAEAARQLCGDAACDLVTLLPGAQPRDGGVLAVVGGRPDDGAALEVAARIWISGLGAVESPATPLGFLPATQSERGRARRLAERLESLGVANVSLDDVATGAPLVVCGWPEDGRMPTGTPIAAGPVALVHTGEDPQRVGIDQRIVRLDLARRTRQPAMNAAPAGPSGPGTSSGAGT
jgi:hypothetical protein